MSSANPYQEVIDHLNKRLVWMAKRQDEIKVKISELDKEYHKLQDEKAQATNSIEYLRECMLP